MAAIVVVTDGCQTAVDDLREAIEERGTKDTIVVVDSLSTIDEDMCTYTYAHDYYKNPEPPPDRWREECEERNALWRERARYERTQQKRPKWAHNKPKVRL